MKNTTALIITLICLFYSPNNYAQENDFENPFSKGKKLIGGGITFQNSDSENTPADTSQYSYQSSNKGFGISPYIGYFIKENLAVGVRGTYSISNYSNTNQNSYYIDTYEREYKNYGIGIFLKKYFDVKGRFGVYISPAINYSHNTNEFLSNDYYIDDNELYNSDQTKVETTGASVSLNMGLYYAISSRFLVEANMLGVNAYYSKGTQTDTDILYNLIEKSDVKNNSINLNFVNTISFDRLFVINYIF